jgi:hypothetical protein
MKIMSLQTNSAAVLLYIHEGKTLILFENFSLATIKKS